MSKLFNILRIQLSAILAYRGTVFFWLCIHVIGFIVMYAFWNAVFSDRTDINGFSLAQMLQYILLTNLIREFVLVTPEYEINDAIRNGTLSSSLLRPFSYPLQVIASSTFWHIIESVFALMIYGLIGYFALSESILNLDLYNIIYVLPIIFLGHIFCSIFSFILGCLAFWFTEASAFFYYKEILVLLTSGLFFPKATTPIWFQSLMETLPFYHTIGAPAEVLVGKMPFTNLWISIIQIAIWIIGAFLLANLLWYRGIKKYESVGN